MIKISLAPYAIRLKEKWGSKLGPLDAFEHSGRQHRDLYAIVHSYLTTLSSQGELDHQAASLLRVKEVYAQSDDRLLSGKIETGDYGYETELFDVEKSEVSHQRTKVEAELRPFYFSFHFPAGKDEANLLLERQGNIGVRVALSRTLKAMFGEEFPELILDVRPLVPQDAVDQICEEGRIKKIRYVKFSFPRDIADLHDEGDHVEGTTELVVSARRGRFLKTRKAIEDFLGRGDRGGVLEVDNGSFDYDTVKLEVQVGKTTRTIDVSYPSRIRAYYDISDEIEIGDDGHPTFSSIHEAATDRREDLLEALYRSTRP